MGPAWVFAGNAATYLFVVAALMAVSLPALPRATQQASRWRQLTAGITTARADPVVGRCLVTVFVFSLLALAFVGQMPVVAAHNLGIDPRSASYGVLYGASFGTGALVGAISIGTVFSRTSKAMIVRVSLLCYAAALTVFALLRTALPAFFAVAVVGAFYFAFITALNTALQTQLSDAVRGRVMALWIMGFGGTVALGNLIIGPVVSTVGIHRGAALRSRSRSPPGVVRGCQGRGRRGLTGGPPPAQATDSTAMAGSSMTTSSACSTSTRRLSVDPGDAIPARARRRPPPRWPAAPRLPR